MVSEWGYLVNEEIKPKMGAVTEAWQEVVQAYWQGQDITVQCPKCGKQHTMRADQVKNFKCNG